MNRRAFLGLLALTPLLGASLAKAISAPSRRLGPGRNAICIDFITKIEGPHDGFFIFVEKDTNVHYQFSVEKQKQVGNTVYPFQYEKVWRVTEEGKYIEVREFDFDMKVQRADINIYGQLCYIDRSIIEPPIVTVKWREMEEIK